MIGCFTDYVNNKVLDIFLGAVPYTPPSTLYFGLSQNTANKGGSVTEPTAGGYARVALSNNTSNFPPASGGTKTNVVAIQFPLPTASWGTITTVFIADAATGGNVLAMADLTSLKSITSGSTAPTIAVSGLYMSHT
jgi:hypothetical protein